MSKAFNLTGEQVMAELTPEEVKGFNLSLPQMTPAAKRFVYLLAYERIQKAALLAACRKALLELAFLVMEVDCRGEDKPIQETLKSAIKAGEA